MSDGPTTTFVPVTLREPPPHVHWRPEALRMSGLELMRAARDRRLPEPPISTLTGIRPTDVGLGKTTFAMPASPWWQSGAGVFLAGTLAFVADAPLGCAILTARHQVPEFPPLNSRRTLCVQPGSGARS